jgi:hypothetical protein
MLQKPEFKLIARSVLLAATLICYFAGVFNTALYLFEKGCRATVDMFAVWQ